MDAALQSFLREQLLDRRSRLTGTLPGMGRAADLVRLLGEVDAALHRMDTHRFGTCDACSESVNEADLVAHPLLTWCLCDLTSAQQDALQRDLNLASRVQWALLPPANLTVDGWETAYRYVPAGPVSGDYCDLARRGDGLWFLAGDVMGHGVAASFLMARLNALFRSLLDLDLPLNQLVERMNRHFLDGTSADHFATLVAGRTGTDGTIEVCNAGHPSPLLVQGGAVTAIEGSGLPVGISASDPYPTQRVALEPGDALVLYTDGLVETQAPSGEMFGVERVTHIIEDHHAMPLPTLTAALLQEADDFRGGGAVEDDVTLLLVRRRAA